MEDPRLVRLHFRRNTLDGFLNGGHVTAVS